MHLQDQLNHYGFLYKRTRQSCSFNTYHSSNSKWYHDPSTRKMTIYLSKNLSNMVIHLKPRTRSLMAWQMSSQPNFNTQVLQECAPSSTLTWEVMQPIKQQTIDLQLCIACKRFKTQTLFDFQSKMTKKSKNSTEFWFHKRCALGAFTWIS